MKFGNRDKVVDVIVIGYGLAGAVAATTAHDEGAETLILEKQPFNDHWSNSSASGGIFISPSDVEGAIHFLEGLYRINEDLYWTDRDIIRVWAEYTVENRVWLEKMGGTVKLLGKGSEHPAIPGSESIDVYRFSGSGYGLMKFFYQQINQRKIEVMYGARAKKLITNLKGEIVGVTIQSSQDIKQKETNIRASKAVILTCGGFEFSEEMKLQYLGLYPVYFGGSPANTGDGIRMAMEVGSDLWHMHCCSAALGAKFPGYPFSFFLDFGGKGWLQRVLWHEDKPESNGFVIVDKYGRRFINENLKMHCAYYELMLFDTQKLDYPRIPCYFIFDQKRMDDGPLPILTAGPTSALQLYKWSQDNRTELEKGWMITAESIKELAHRLDMSPHILESTIMTYNAYSQGGKDIEFNRRAGDLVPLNNPPFYAIQLWPGGPNTQGGPKRNRRAQIVAIDGTPIPRLYSAGELGSIYGMLYPQGGSNLAECIAFGRIAGENAVKEKT
ncbi:MAG: FAD-binding protein [Chloroflexota bacterium]|nr:FAD-binding protein [Chloroflexota bacterium]